MKRQRKEEICSHVKHLNVEQWSVDVNEPDEDTDFHNNVCLWAFTGLSEKTFAAGFKRKGSNTKA